MLSNIRIKILNFLSSNNNTKNLPIIAAIASGLYPFLYNYNYNYTLVNSWSQLAFFIISFIIIPSIIFPSIYFLFNRINFLKGYSKYVIPVLNYCFFSILLVICTYGFHKKILLLSVLVAFILAILFYKFVRKLIVLQLLLALLGFIILIPNVYIHLTYSNEWMKQPDSIEEVVFKMQPNIYVIQPDGYANFSELKKGYYNFNNNEFEQFLSNNNFKLYNNFRSNYFSTLSSNSSMFAMKHHYYYNTKKKKGELFNARDIIVGENPVLSIFKKNEYKTFLMLEESYLLLNRPKTSFDYCNINLKELSYFARGFGLHKDLKEDIKHLIGNNSTTNNFFLIEKLTPSHMPNTSSASLGKDKERIAYLKRLEETNVWLKDIVDIIIKKDNNSIIVIVADHGGFVGFNNMDESREKQKDNNLVNSIFTSALAIKWSGEHPDFDDKLKTSVNLFRVLFTYLSENEIYLQHLQEDKSFMTIEKGAPIGVYEYINGEGEVVFNKLSN